uniref:LRAT domain-containing protein n=1 Tax=Globodera pallida TaxID=36090 RepID=A0A183BZ17_GLOPA
MRVEDLSVGDMVNCKMDAGPMTVTHRGIYVGYTAQGGRHSVVHNFCGENTGKKQMKKGGGDGGVIIWSMDVFEESANNEYWWVDNNWLRFGPTPYTGEQIAQRALNRVGERDYRFLSHNCEHFAFWCRYNVAWSPQADDNLLVQVVRPFCSIM